MQTALVPAAVYFISGRWFVRGIAAGVVEPNQAPAIGAPVKAHFVPSQASLFDSAIGVRI